MTRAETIDKTKSAAQTLAALQDKLTAARARHAEALAGTKSHAYAAHVDGDVEAMHALQRHETNLVTLAAEIISLESAIAEAERRLAVEESALADEADRDNAAKSLKLLDAFEERGRALDEKLAAFVAEYEDLVADFKKLDALGFAPTSHALIGSNMRTAVATKLQFTELRQDFLAPHARRDFVEVISAWAANVRARASARLNRANPQKAA